MKPHAMNSLEEVDSEVAKLVSSGIHIPPQPKIVIEVLKLLHARQSDLREMAHLIGQDAGLTAMLYKITRSAAYARSRPPQSVDQILSLVGMRQSALLVQAYGVTSSLQGDSVVLEKFWQRSGDIAQLASLISYERTQAGVPLKILPEQAYMVGIFHDCGVPILMQRFADYGRQTGVGSGSRWIDPSVEDQLFQVDHCSLGYLLARHWRLPDFVTDAILLHHELSRVEAPQVRRMVGVLQMAIHLHMDEQGAANPDWGRDKTAVLEELGIHPDDLTEFSDGILDMYHAAQAT